MRATCSLGHYSCQSLLTGARSECWRWEVSPRLLQRPLLFLKKAFKSTSNGHRRKKKTRPQAFTSVLALHRFLWPSLLPAMHRPGGIYFKARLYLAVMSTAANYKKLSNALWKCNSCCSTHSLVYYQSALFHVHTTKIKYCSNHLII